MSVTVAELGPGLDAHCSFFDGSGTHELRNTAPQPSVRGRSGKHGRFARSLRPGVGTAGPRLGTSRGHVTHRGRVRPVAALPASGGARSTGAVPGRVGDPGLAGRRPAPAVGGGGAGPRAHRAARYPGGAPHQRPLTPGTCGGHREEFRPDPRACARGRPGRARRRGLRRPPGHPARRTLHRGGGPRRPRCALRCVPPAAARTDPTAAGTRRPHGAPGHPAAHGQPLGQRRRFDRARLCGPVLLRLEEAAATRHPVHGLRAGPGLARHQRRRDQ